MYNHIVDENGKLWGIIDVKELLQADNKALLKEIMRAYPKSNIMLKLSIHFISHHLTNFMRDFEYYLDYDSNYYLK
jgi:hypothetical protein